MKNITAAKSFVAEFGLEKGYTCKDLKEIAHKLGYKIFGFERRKSSHEEILVSMKALELSNVKDCFTHNHSEAKYICINANIPEREKKIGMLHELVHIYLGHLNKGSTITIAEEKQATDIHFIIDRVVVLKQFMQWTKTVLGVCVMIALLLICADGFKYPEKYITTWKYHLQNKINRGDPEAIKYYNDVYIANGVKLFD